MSRTAQNEVQCYNPFYMEDMIMFLQILSCAISYTNHSTSWSVLIFLECSNLHLCHLLHFMKICQFRKSLFY